jgi:hypothetical protein
MQTVQVMRARAQAAGNLQSTPQEQVTVDQDNIVLAPPDSQMVYVPSYNPWAVYGAPVQQYPGYDWLGAVGSFFGNAFIQWGPGIAMQAFAATPFGWIGWGLDWLSHAVLFNHSDYCTHSYEVRDWGFRYGGPRGFRGWDRPGFHDGRGWGRDRFLLAGNRHGFDRGLDRGFGQQSGRFISDRQRFGNDRSASGYRGYGNAWGGSQYQRNGSFAYAGRPQAGVQHNYGSVHGSGYRSGYGSANGSGYLPSRGTGYGSGTSYGYGSRTYSRGNSYPSYPGRSGSYSSPAYRSSVSPYRGDQGSRSNYAYTQLGHRE